jgi:integrase
MAVKKVPVKKKRVGQKSRAELTNLPTVHKKKYGKKGKKRIRLRDNSRSEQTPICDGECQIFKSKPSGEVWQFEMKLATELHTNTKNAKYLRRSLKTKSVEIARKKGRELWIQVLAKVESDQPIFTLTSAELVDDFLKVKKGEVGINKTLGRYNTIRTQLKHYLDFVGADSKITDIDRNIWDGYYRYRRDQRPEVTDDTLGNEKSSIRSLYRYAIRKEYLPQRYLPEFPATGTKEKRKRRALRVDEYRTIYEHMRSKNWSNTGDKKHDEQRKMVYWGVLVMANVGMRFGELRRLRWSNVEKITKEADETQVHILFQADQTKNKKSRRAIGRRGDVFRTIKKYSKWTESGDFIFSDQDTGEGIHREIYYKWWHLMLDETGLQKNSTERLSFYNLRHLYATQRLYSGISPYLLAKSMGCSIRYLEEHYEHIEMELMADQMTKKVQHNKAGQVILK